MDLTEYLNAAETDEVAIEIKHRGELFTLRLKPCDRVALDTIRRKSTDRKLNARTRQYEDTVNEAKLREGLIEQCVVGWDGLTFAKAATLLGKRPPNGALQEQGGATVPFTAAHALQVLGGVIGIEDAIWEASLQRAESEAIAEGHDRGN